MGVKYSLVHRSATVARSGRVRSHGYSTREAVKLCHIGVADSKDKQKGAIASFVLGSDRSVLHKFPIPIGLEFTCSFMCSLPYIV